MISTFHFWAIHILIFLSLFALMGYLKQNKKYQIFFCVLAFYGALCFVFVALFKAIGG
ncbi:MAG: hypothetical protein Q8L01_03300 [Candidatus Woesebacteria bacterium]|nr:hypothetical protein [Candidatus Woesebacteria bacterium]